MVLKKKKINKLKKNFTNILICLILIVASLDFFLNLLDKKNKIKNFVFNKVNNTKYNNSEHKFWSNEIKKGGYILYFRHAFREDGENSNGDLFNVWTYDALELNKNYNTKDSFVSKATCLTKNGKILAKTIGEYFKIFKINASKVISSPSCRSKQHAELSFTKIDRFYNQLVHYGPWNEKISVFEENIKKILINEQPMGANNTIIVAHNGVMSKNIFDDYPLDMGFYLKQGGFYLIKIENEKIILKHKFNEFYEFSNTLLTRPPNIEKF